MTDLCTTCRHAKIQPGLLPGMGTSHCTHPTATRPAEDPDDMPSHMTTKGAISPHGPCAGGRLYERKTP